jgi:hypothetical protein
MAPQRQADKSGECPEFVESLADFETEFLDGRSYRWNCAAGFRIFSRS